MTSEVPEVTQPKTISLAPDMSQYFHGAVIDAIRAREVAATAAAERYLVGLLVDYAHPTEEPEATLEQPVTFLLRDARAASGPERFRRLRALGDGVLYTAGFFGEHIEQGGADRRYVVHVGSTAYSEAAEMVSSGPTVGGPDVLRELSENYETFMEVLASVSERSRAQSANTPGAVVKLYERWLKTGSAVLGAELTARGLVPVRGEGGEN